MTSTSADTTWDVIVLGAGIAGLATARNLRESGASVVVVEGRDRIGGRLEYRQFPGTSTSVEMGGAWVSSVYHERIMREVDRYGLGLIQEHEAEWKWALDRPDYTEGFPLSGDEFFELERCLVEASIAARRVDPNMFRDQQGGLDDLDVSFAAWVEALGVSDRVATFLHMYASIGIGAVEDAWSALDAFSLLAGMGCSPMGWLATCGEKFEKGTISLLEWLAEGIDVRLGSIVSAVRSDDDGVTVETSSGTLRARDVVVALPVNTWTDVEFSPALGPDKSELAEVGNQGRMIKLWLLVDDAPPNLFTLGRASELLCVSTQYEVDEGTLLVAFASPPRDLDPHDRDGVARALGQVLPDATLIDYIWHDWVGDEFSRGTWMGYPPGFLASRASRVAAPEGRLSFAGSDLARTWIGWMEGALESADRATDEVSSRSQARFMR